MPRNRTVNPKRSWQVRLPEDLAARVLLDLHSEVEGCVPYGKWSEFIEMCIREHYRERDSSVTTTFENGTVIHRHPSLLNGKASHNPGIPCYECYKLLGKDDSGFPK